MCYETLWMPDKLPWLFFVKFELFGFTTNWITAFVQVDAVQLNHEVFLGHQRNCCGWEYTNTEHQHPRHHECRRDKHVRQERDEQLPAQFLDK